MSIRARYIAVNEGPKHDRQAFQSIARIIPRGKLSPSKTSKKLIPNKLELKRKTDNVCKRKYASLITASSSSDLKPKRKQRGLPVPVIIYSQRHEG